MDLTKLKSRRKSRRVSSANSRAEGIVIVGKYPERFEPMFDVTTSLAMRELDRNLAVLGTISNGFSLPRFVRYGCSASLTFGELANTDGAGGNVGKVMFRIGSAPACGNGGGVGRCYCGCRAETTSARGRDSRAISKCLKLVLLSVVGGRTRARATRRAARRTLCASSGRSADIAVAPRNEPRRPRQEARIWRD